MEPGILTSFVPKFQRDEKMELQRPGDSSPLPIQNSKIEKHFSTINFQLKSSNHKFTIDDDDLRLLKIAREEFDEIIHYVTTLSLEKNTVIKRNKSGLPFTVAFDAKEKNIIIFCKEHRLGKLGEGTNNKVTLGWDVKSQSTVAIRSGDERERTDIECKINKLLSVHKELFVVAKDIFSYKGPFSKNDFSISKKSKVNYPKIAMVLERMETSLYEYWPHLDLKRIVLIIRDILKGLDVLHNEYKIVHRDLKLNNILLSLSNPFKENFNAKIADFDAAHFKGTHSKIWGNHYCMAPEVKLDKLYHNRQKVSQEMLSLLLNSTFPIKADFPEDMWSFGVILLEMISTDDIFDTWKKIYNNNYEFDFEFQDAKNSIFDELRNCYENASVPDRELVEDIINIISRCLLLNPQERLTVKEAREILGD